MPWASSPSLCLGCEARSWPASSGASTSSADGERELGAADRGRSSPREDSWLSISMPMSTMDGSSSRLVCCEKGTES